jgi:hypothetical protein
LQNHHRLSGKDDQEVNAKSVASRHGASLIRVSRSLNSERERPRLLSPTLIQFRQ